MQKLRISNLPRWTSEIHLKQFFHQCGKIVHASVALDQVTLRPLGFGFLVFDTDEAMQRAMDKDGALFDGSTISVKLADSVDEVLA